jgi:hypothetical protein
MGLEEQEITQGDIDRCYAALNHIDKEHNISEIVLFPLWDLVRKVKWQMKHRK